MVRITVKILTSSGCRLCGRAKGMIRSAASRAGVELDLVELNIDDPDPKPAIDHAREEHLEHLPSFKIGAKHIFIEDIFTEDDLYRALCEARYDAGDTKIGT